MDSTSNLGLPFLQPAQAQKHVTHNEALLTLDVIAQLVLQSIGQNTPPDQPEEGQAFALGAQPDAEWEGRGGQIAAYQDRAWRFYQPKNGWTALVREDGGLHTYENGQWQALSGVVTVSEQFTQLGINSSADENNRLTVASGATLLTHDGTDHRLVINRNRSEDVSSVIFQTGFQGEAEIGLAGPGGFAVRTSLDGTNWQSRMEFPIDDGPVTFDGGLVLPFGPSNLLINSEFQINQRGFNLPELAAGSYGHDRWRAGPAGAQYQLNAGAITLAAGALEQVLELTSTGEVAQTFTLGVEVLSGTLTISFGGQTQVFSARAGLQTATFQALLRDDAERTLRLEGVTSFRGLSLCAGRGTAGAGVRPIGLELLLCQRYYSTSFTQGGPVGPTSGDNYHLTSVSWHPENVASSRVTLPTRMRTVPTIQLFSSIGGGDNSWYIINNGLYQTVIGQPNRVDRQSFVINAAQSGLNLGVGLSYFIGGHWAADAEFHT